MTQKRRPTAAEQRAARAANLASLRDSQFTLRDGQLARGVSVIDRLARAEVGGTVRGHRRRYCFEARLLGKGGPSSFRGRSPQRSAAPLRTASLGYAQPAPVAGPVGAPFGAFNTARSGRSPVWSFQHRPWFVRRPQAQGAPAAGRRQRLRVGSCADAIYACRVVWKAVTAWLPLLHTSANEGGERCDTRSWR
jgi:hypothetical protein